MNDCFWSWCDACNCTGICDKYLSVNSIEGDKVLIEYTRQISNAIRPVKEEYKKMFEDFLRHKF